MKHAVAALLMMLSVTAAPAWAQDSGIARVWQVESATADAGIDGDAVRGLPQNAFIDQGPTSQLADRRGWWRVQPATGGDAARLLLVFHPYSARVTVLAPPDYVPETQTVFDATLDPRFSRRALAFPLDADGPVFLQVDGARYPLQIAVRGTDAHIADDLVHVRVISTVTGVLMGISLVVLLFWLMLRERVYLLYAITMSLQLLYVLCSYGEAYALPGLRALSRFGAQGIWVIATLGTAAAAFFLIDLAGLQQRAPWPARLLRWIGGHASLALVALLLLPWPASKEWFPSVGNLTLLLANLLALTGLAVALFRGERRAGYALLAWVPLVSLSTARAVQLGIGMPLTPWVEYGLPIGLAFASILLVLVLADRMLTVRRERDNAKQHAERDALTDVLNRSGIEQRLDWAIASTRGEKVALCAAFLDLDHFKHINDSHGHGVGDDCLRALVRTAAAEMQYGDHIGRMGGEEFVLVLPGSNRRHARDTAERIRVGVENLRVTVGDTVLSFTVSIGVAECDGDDTAASLVERADQAMYAAKRSGRNRVVVAASNA